MAEGVAMTERGGCECVYDRGSFAFLPCLALKEYVSQKTSHRQTVKVRQKERDSEKDRGIEGGGGRRDSGRVG